MTNIHSYLKISRYSGHKHSKQFNFYKKIRFRYFRYRKDTTGNLDEVQIEHIAKLQKVMKQLPNAKKQ
jgi:transcriptional accessory protein Tex/SPT6